jgi:hypothetical protein
MSDDQALVTALRERAEVAETDKEIAVEDNIRLMNEAERLQADLASARQAIDLLNERQRQEWAQAEWDLVACGTDPETGRRRCTYSWSDGTRETFVEGIHPLHIKGQGRAVRPEGP